MTDGGRGVAFFSPFNNRRYFFSWTPIGNFFAEVWSELLWIWLSADFLAAVAWTLRHQGHP
jgi:inner membrane protein